ncbi:ParB/Srx family N-terminal domain-containing protein [Streptococcus ictaluri]|nr:ParB/Srx family N-terminal domain-containing protein [Streptococcus ictaluri]
MDQVATWLTKETINQMSAITVRRFGDGFYILDGHTRAFWAMRLGFESLLCELR